MTLRTATPTVSRTASTSPMSRTTQTLRQASRSRRNLCVVAGLAALLCATPAGTFAQAAAGDTAGASSTRVTSASNSRPLGQMPAGYLFIYDADGEVSFRKGAQTIRAQQQQTLAASQPIEVTLGNSGSIAIVFSNGVGMWAKGPGSFSISRFEQTPFQGNSRQNPYEPTSSVLEMDLKRGTFAFNERQLSALSTVRLNFGTSVLDAHETTSFLVQVGGGVQGDQDRISVLNGRALLHSGRNRGSAVLIGTGQYLLQERRSATEAQQLRLPEQLTTSQQEADARTAHYAQVVNDRIWFVREQGSDAAQAQVVVPVNFWLGKPHAATRVR